MNKKETRGKGLLQFNNLLALSNDFVGKTNMKTNIASI